MLVNLLNNVINNVRRYEYVKLLIRDVVDLMREEYVRSNGIPLLPNTGNYVIVGDLHGDITSLEYILKAVEKLELSEYTLIFLGDYVDRGTGQVETISTLLEIKLRYPDKVFLLRGNHEPPDYLPVYPHDFPHELTAIYGIVNGRKLYEEFKRAFQLLPRALIIKEIALLLHGGPPIYNIDSASGPHEYLLGRNFEEDAKVLEDILWNDPIEGKESFIESYRGAGHMFGTKVTEAALRITGTKLVIRGHEPCLNGFKFNHNKKVLTLFSRLGPPYNNKLAAFLKLYILPSNNYTMEVITFSDKDLS